MKPQIRLADWWLHLFGRTTPAEIQRAKEEQAIRRDMAQARRDWEAAEQYFQSVTEPELVEHAIFTMEAAKRKYLYLFRQLRRVTGGRTGQEELPWM